MVTSNTNKGQLCLRTLEVLQNSLLVFILHNIVKIECYLKNLKINRILISVSEKPEFSPSTPNKGIKGHFRIYV